MPIQDEEVNDATIAPVLIPHTELQADTLRRVIESYVLREGTEYGDQDVTLEAKVAQVSAQLQRGDAVIAFHPESESVDIVMKRSTIAAVDRHVAKSAI